MEEKDANFESLCRIVQKGNVDAFRKIIPFFRPKWLVQKINKKSADNIFHVASRFGRLEILEILFQEILASNSLQILSLMPTPTTGVDENFLSVLDSINSDRKTPLHEAAQANHLNCVQFLLKHKVQVDSMKRADWTPLMLSVAKGNQNVIEELLKASANPALVNKDGWNSFHLACREGNLEIVKLLSNSQPDLWKVSSKNGRTALHTAALHNCQDVVRWLVESCQHPIDVKDSCGTTPLMDALRMGHIKLVARMLQEFQANPNETDHLGYNLLHIASQSGNLSSVEFILANFDVNVVSLKNLTPLHLAAKEGHTNIVSYLLSHGADVDLQDDMKRTAMTFAELGRHFDCIEILKRSSQQKNKINPIFEGKKLQS